MSEQKFNNPLEADAHSWDIRELSEQDELLLAEVADHIRRCGFHSNLYHSEEICPETCVNLAKEILAKVKQHYGQEKRVGVNWSNCPEWNQCKDENKHIMTYCDVSCSKKRLDRPELREKIDGLLGDFGAEVLVANETGRMHPDLRMEATTAFLALIPDIEECNQLCCDFIAEEARKQGKREVVEMVSRIHSSTSNLTEMEERLITMLNEYHREGI